MVLCAMVGCANRSGRDRARFFRFPGATKNFPRSEFKELTELTALRRTMWLARIGRQDLIANEAKLNHTRVCSRHFIKGEPAALTDVENPDWAPSVNLGHNYYLRFGRKNRRNNHILTPSTILGHDYFQTRIEEIRREASNMPKKNIKRNVKSPKTFIPCLSPERLEPLVISDKPLCDISDLAFHEFFDEALFQSVGELSHESSYEPTFSFSEIPALGFVEELESYGQFVNAVDEPEEPTEIPKVYNSRSGLTIIFLKKIS